jgi:hypothetical protein
MAFNEERFEQAVSTFLLISEAVPPSEFISAFGHFLALRMCANRKEIDNQLKLLKESVETGLAGIDKEIAVLKGDANVQ